MLKLRHTMMMTLFLAACEQDTLKAPAVQPTLEVHTPDGTPATYETTELSFVITHPRDQEEDFVTVEILNPKGKVYTTQKLTLPADGRVTVSMPVCGTFIEDRAMTGTWSALVYYNYATTPAMAVPFTIDPH